MKKIMIVACLFLVACGGASHETLVAEVDGKDTPDVIIPPSNDGGSASDCIPEGMSLVDFAQVKSELLEVSCAQCHSAANGSRGGINTDTFENVSDHLMQITDSIEAGRMPLGPALTEEQKNLLASWMNLGAPETVDELVICEE